MSQRGWTWMALSLALALLPAAAALGDDQCPYGAVNAITGVNVAGTPVPAEDTRCEICVFVRVQTGDYVWEDVGSVCGISSDEQAYDVMFRIGRCGLILPSADTAGRFYGASVPVRAHAERMAPCQ